MINLTEETTFTSTTGQAFIEIVTNMSLHEASVEGELDTVKYILFYHLEDINSRGKYGRTPVMAAASVGQKDVFDYLVSQNCDFSIRDKSNKGPVHMACIGGSVDIVRKVIIDLEQNMDEIDDFGWTPVMLAVHFGHSKVVKFLVSKGCNVKLKNSDSNNILHIACREGHLDIVNFTVKRKLVSIDSKGDHGKTAVMTAISNGHKEIVKLLIQEGCNLRLVNTLQETILHIACRKNQVDVVNYILTRNIVNKESKDTSGRTPLMAAVRGGHKEVFDLLVHSKCNWKTTDNQNNNILHLACLADHTELLEYIIEQYKVDIDIESRGGHASTPVLFAAWVGNLAAVKLLVQKGCNMTAVDSHSHNVLHLACVSDRVELIRYLINQTNIDLENKAYKQRTALLIAANLGNINAFRFLVSKGCNLKAVDEDGNDMSHLACGKGHLPLVKFIWREFKVDKERKGFRGMTPVLVAASQGHRAVVEFLQGKGCNMSEVDNEKNNIIHLACVGGHINMVRYLIRQRIVSINDRNNNGSSPIEVARMYGHKGIVELLKLR